MTTPEDVDTPKVRRLRDIIDANIKASIEAHAAGDSIDWDTSYVMTQEGVHVLVAVWLKGVILGSFVNFAWSMNPQSYIDPEQCDKIITDGLAQAREARAQAMQAQMNDAAATGQAQQNGGGLLLP